MTKADERRKLLIVGSVTSLLCTIGGGGLFWADQLAAEKLESLASMQTEIRAARAKIKRVPSLEHDVIVLRENVQEYVKILPEQREMNNFIRTASMFQKQAGIPTLTKFEPGKPAKASKGSSFERYTYRFEFESTLWQFMKMLSLFENYERFVKVKSFSLASGLKKKQSKPQEGNDRHRISMTVETYVYKAPGKSEDITISNYSNKVERKREEILAKRQDISTVAYEFTGARGRRDVFIDPQESKLAMRLDAISLREQEKLVETLRKKIAAAQDLHGRMNDSATTIFVRHSLKGNLLKEIGEIEAEVRDIEEKGYIASSTLKLAWTKDIRDPLDMLSSMVSESPVRAVDGDRWLTAEMMKKLAMEMKQDLLKGRLQAAMDRYGAVQNKLDVPRLDGRYTHAKAIAELYVRAKTVFEFETKQLDISGVCINAEGKSAVIMNGLVYVEGDRIDDEMILKSVERGQVEFLYKGFTLIKAM